MDYFINQTTSTDSKFEIDIWDDMRYMRWDEIYEMRQHLWNKFKKSETRNSCVT